MDEIRYYATNPRTKEHMTVLPFEECIDIIRYRYERMKDLVGKVNERNTQLRSEHFKDETIQSLQKKLKEMEEDYYLRGFPIGEKEQASIDAWKKKHDEEVHGYDTFEKRLKAEGVSGGRYSYHFVPTSIGISGVIKCNCGAEFEFREIG